MSLTIRTLTPAERKYTYAQSRQLIGQMELLAVTEVGSQVADAPALTDELPALGLGVFAISGGKG